MARVPELVDSAAPARPLALAEDVLADLARRRLGQWAELDRDGRFEVGEIPATRVSVQFA